MLYPLSYGRFGLPNHLVYRDLLLSSDYLVVTRRVLLRSLFSNRITTDSVELPHVLLKADAVGVQVVIRLVDGRVSQHIPHGVERPTGFKPAGDNSLKETLTPI